MHKFNGIVAVNSHAGFYAWFAVNYSHMWYLLAALFPAILLLDVLRSHLVARKIRKLFFEHNREKTKAAIEKIGSGPAFHLVILGDSSFDVRGDTEVAFGPAQVFIDTLAKQHTVHVHLLAQAGAKSYDVIAKQLPKLKALSRVDLVIVYMGPNNAVYFKQPIQVGRDYQELLAWTEAQKIPVVASEVANYWYLTIFSLVHRAWLYYAVHVENICIRRAFKGAKYATLVSINHMHKNMHKKRRKEPYLLDGFHPDDACNIIWGKYLLREASKNPLLDRKILTKVR